jgi:hypothetical protein
MPRPVIPPRVQYRPRARPVASLRRFVQRRPSSAVSRVRRRAAREQRLERPRASARRRRVRRAPSLVVDARAQEFRSRFGVAQRPGDVAARDAFAERARVVVRAERRAERRRAAPKRAGVVHRVAAVVARVTARGATPTRARVALRGAMDDGT